MTEPGVSKPMTFEDLIPMREQTERVSDFLQRRLQAHLEAVRPVLSPRRLLGKYVGGNDDVPGASALVARLREQYAQTCGKPFALVPELDLDALAGIEGRVELYPWEYAHTAKNARETKTVTMTSPVRWVIAYRSGYTLSELRRVLTGKETRRQEALRQFLVNALLMRLVFETSQGLAQLFGDLRYEVARDRSPELGDLELVTISACLPSFRPSDDLILMATRFSGVPAFIELVDADAVHALKDPLRVRVEELLGGDEAGSALSQPEARATDMER